MKKTEKKIFYIVLFCAIAIALFSLENTMQLEEDGLIEEIRMPITRREATDANPQSSLIQESSNSSPSILEEPQTRPLEEFIPMSTQETIPPTNPHVVEKEEAKNMATPSVEKTPTDTSPKEDIKEKKENAQNNEETEFSSIQSCGLTLANGDEWYFEEYDENGNIISVASYNKNRLISKSQFEYNEEGKKVRATLTEPKKITKLTFNEKGMEIERTEYKKRRGEIGDVNSSHQKVYDDEGILKEEISIENGITTKKVYTYNDKKLATETIFENDVKTLFIEYQENIKIIHIFDEDIEINTFEEALEWKATGFFLC